MNSILYFIPHFYINYYNSEVVAISRSLVLIHDLHKLENVV